jgi:phage terminase large subunit
VGRVETRQRNARHLVTQREPVRLEWASEKQKEVFCHGPVPQCASGGFGSSKSYAFCLKALQLSDLYPRNRGVIARRVWDELRRTTMSTFFKLCPPQAYDQGKRSDTEKILRLNNGSEILWLHLDDPETENVIRGLEINWFFIDQAEEIEEEIFDMMCSRLGRWDQAVVPEHVLAEHGGIEKWPYKNPMGKPIVPTYPMIACNPDTELHWIYRRFHPDSPEHWEKNHRGPDGSKMSYHDLGYKLWTMSSEENKFLPKQNLDLMLQKDESFVRRFVRGEWGIPEGQIHTIDPLSVIDGTPDFVEYLKQTCTLHRSMDHGDASPTAVVWWAVDKSGNIFAMREYYVPNKLVSDHRKEIASLSEGEKYVLNLADPSIFFLMQQKYGGRWSTADEWADVKNLARHTAVFWQPADNNELGTRNRISEYLRVDPDRVHPTLKTKGAPRLFFVKRSNDYPQGCYHLLREVKAQRREKIGSEAGRPIFSDERDDDISDHGYDCLRYFIASRPPVGVDVAAARSKRTFMGVRNDYLRFKKKGGFAMLADKRKHEVKKNAANV